MNLPTPGSHTQEPQDNIKTVLRRPLVGKLFYYHKTFKVLDRIATNSIFLSPLSILFMAATQISETKIPGDEDLEIGNCHVFLHGKPGTSEKESGVGIILSHCDIKAWTAPGCPDPIRARLCGNAGRIIALHLKFPSHQIFFITCHMPLHTNCSDAE